jgi:hypothetical protein
MSKVIKVEYVGTKDQISDVFTKPLPMSYHTPKKYHMQKL